MTKHESKACPRCHSRFECKSGSIELCQCRTVALTDELHQHIANTFMDCLCAKCLETLRIDYHRKKFDEGIKKALGTR